MKTRRRTCTHGRTKAERGSMALSSVHLSAIRAAVAATFARFSTQLPPECAEEAIQDTLLSLWKSPARHSEFSVPYVRRAAQNTAIDLIRRQSAQKRSLHRAETFDLVRALWQPPRTPEEILIEREEAHRLLMRDRSLRKRVERLMRQMTKGGALCPG